MSKDLVKVVVDRPLDSGHLTLQVYTPFNEALRSHMKGYGGFQWNGVAKCWQIIATSQRFPSTYDAIIRRQELKNFAGSIGYRYEQTLLYNADADNGTTMSEATAQKITMEAISAAMSKLGDQQRKLVEEEVVRRMRAGLPIDDLISALNPALAPTITPSLGLGSITSAVGGIPGASAHASAPAPSFFKRKSAGSDPTTEQNPTVPVNIPTGPQPTSLPLMDTSRAAKITWSDLPEEAKESLTRCATQTFRFPSPPAVPLNKEPAPITFCYDALDMVTPYLHQVDVLANFATTYNKRMIVAHEPGMGKTLTAIMVACAYNPTTRKLIVCPEHLREMWAREFRRAGYRTFIYGVDKMPGKLWSETRDGVLIVGYASTIKDTMEKVGREDVLKAGLLIVDEGQYCGSMDAQRTQRVIQWADRIPHVLWLSGTPAPSRIAQLFPALRALRPTEYPNFMRFAVNYCGAKKTKFGWDFSGSSNLNELSLKLITVMHRRRKTDTKDLPDKQVNIVPLSIPAEAAAKFNAKLKEAFAEDTGNINSRNRALGAFTKMRAEAWSLKKAAILNWIQDFLETDRKLVVFAHHQEVADAIAAFMRGARPDRGVGVVHGGIPASNREAAVENFQKDPGVIGIVGTYGAMGTGVTLTAADTMVMAEYDWVPSTLRQAEDRIHRIGQTNACSINYLVAAGTLDEVMVRTVTRKSNVLGQVIDGLSESEDAEVMDKIASELTSPDTGVAA